jgi:crotonobetainyl-CoA:carnitine CoA-transferase CaiB-like acyl-CoA transferase
VYVSLSGWGQTGPAAQDPGHNATYLARAGATHLTGPRGSDPSDEVPVEIADLGAALYSVIGILSALRNRRPEGVRLDISLFGSAVALLAPRLAEYAAKGNPSRDDLLRRPAHGTFRTADGRFLTIAAVEDSFWIGLCEAIGRPDLGRRQDLADYNARCAHADEIDEAVSAALGSGSCEHWLDILSQYDVPAVPVLEPWQLPDDPQVRHLGALPAWPDVRAFLPISGLSTTTATAVPEIDSSGPAIRRSGWAGLTLMPDPKLEDSAHG